MTREFLILTLGRPLENIKFFLSQKSSTNTTIILFRKTVPFKNVKYFE